MSPTRILLLSSALALSACDTSLMDAPEVVSAVESDALESDALESDLVHLREEEKVARDVYLSLYDEWGVEVFANIAQSEQQHMNSVKKLLDRYGFEDPVLDDSVGAFENEELQALFDSLMEKGLQSEVDALEVGATIEDLDIFDIREMRERTDESAVLDVYDALECGSNNHMRSFTGALGDRDTVYEVQFLPQDDYEAILAGNHGGCG